MATHKKRKGMRKGSKTSHHRGISRRRASTIESGGRSSDMEIGGRS